LTYPPEWEGVDALFFNSAQDCCSSFFPGEDCQIDNVCDTTQTPDDQSPAATSPCMWHPDMVHKDGCSNSPNVPVEWTMEAVYNNYHYSTSEACCDRFFSGKKCAVYDECGRGTASQPSLSTSSEPQVTPPVSFSQQVDLLPNHMFSHLCWLGLSSLRHHAAAINGTPMIKIRTAAPTLQIFLKSG